MNEAQEIARLREEVAGMRQGYASLRPDVDKLLRSLYGETDGEASFYRGFFREFGAHRQEIKTEFEKVRQEVTLEFRTLHDENRRLKMELGEVKETCDSLSSTDQRRKRREERLARWALPIVVAFAGTVFTSVATLIIVTLQTYWLTP